LARSQRTTQMAEERKIQINVDTSRATSNVNDLNKDIDKTGEAVGGLTSSLDKMTGGLITGFKGAVGGIRNGIKAMKSLKVAVAATGIGALLIAITALTSYFTKTQRGADKLSQAMKGIGAVVDVLVDRISTFGEGLFKILSGDFSEGIDILKGTFAGLGDEIRNEAQAAIDLEKAQQALEDRQIELINVNAKRRASIEELRLAAEDQTKSDDQRAAALKEAVRLQNEIADDEIAIAKERARIITERIALGESSRDDIREQAEAEARVTELEAERSRRLKQLQTRLNSFTKDTEGNTEKTDENAEAQKKLNEEIAKRDEALAQAAADFQTQLAEQYDAILQSQESAQTQELNAVEDKYNQLLANAEQYGFDEAELARIKNEEINAINKKYDDEDSARKKQKAADDQAIQLANLQVVAGALNGLGQLAGENAAAGKAISAAEAIINTYTGATKALAQGGIFGTIAAAGVIASGIASVRSIYATDVPTPSPSNVSVGGRQFGGGSRGSTPSIPTPNIPRPQGLNANIGFDTTGANLGNQIAESLQGTAMRAYVVNQDIQSAQKLDRKIEETATFG
jgi:hypothetical protein